MCLLVSNMVNISSYNSHAKEGFSDSSVGEESTCNADSILEVGRSAGEEIGYPLQYSCLGNPMDRGAWWATVHGVAQSQTRLSTHSRTHCISWLMAQEWVLRSPVGAFDYSNNINCSCHIGKIAQGSITKSVSVFSPGTNSRRRQVIML